MHCAMYIVRCATRGMLVDLKKIPAADSTHLHSDQGRTDGMESIINNAILLL